MKKPKSEVRPKYTPAATIIDTIPRAILQTLDSRLRGGESGQTLLVWFNALPEVGALRNAHLQGREFTSDDILAWEHERMLSFSPKRSGRSDTSAPPSVIAARSDPDANRQYLNAITAYYAELLIEWAGDPMNHHLPRLKMLERGVKTMLAVRRAELQAERQRFQREKAASQPSSKGSETDATKSGVEQSPIPPPRQVSDPPPPAAPSHPNPTPAGGEEKSVPCDPCVPSAVSPPSPPPGLRNLRPGYSVGMLL